MYLPNQLGDAHELESQYTTSILEPSRSHQEKIDQKPHSPRLNRDDSSNIQPLKLPRINEHRSESKFQPKLRPVTRTSNPPIQFPQILPNNPTQDHVVQKLQPTALDDIQEIQNTENLNNQSNLINHPHPIVQIGNFHDETVTDQPEVKNNISKSQTETVKGNIIQKNEEPTPDPENGKTEKEEESKTKEEEKSCRICFEQEQNEEIGKLIIPCRCTGSMKWIHDECLKTWIVSKRQDIRKASCELCGTSFNMKFTYKLKFYPKMACEEGMVSLFSCICLSIIVSGLIAVIGYLGASWSSQSIGPASGNSTSFKLAIVISAAIICGILIALIIVTVREAFFIVEVDRWNILKPDLTKEPLDIRRDESGASIISNQRSPQNRQTQQAHREEGAQRSGEEPNVTVVEGAAQQRNDVSMQIDVNNTDGGAKNQNNEAVLPEANDEINNSMNDSKMSDVVLIKSPRPIQNPGSETMVRAFSQASVKGEEANKSLRESNTALNKKEPDLSRPPTQNLRLSLSKLPRRESAVRSSMGDEWQQSDINRYMRDLSNRSDAMKVMESMNAEKFREQIQQPMWIEYEEFVPNRETNNDQQPASRNNLRASTNNLRASNPQIERSETPIIPSHKEIQTKKAHAVSAIDFESQAQGQNSQNGTIKRIKETPAEKSTPVLLYQQIPKEFISTEINSEKKKIIEVVVSGQQQKILTSTEKSNDNLPKDSKTPVKKTMRKGASQYIIDSGRPSKVTKARSSANARKFYLNK